MYSTLQKKLPILCTVSPFSVPFSVSFCFTVPFTVLPFHFAVLPFQVQTIERAGCTESGDSGRVSRDPKAWEVQRDNFNGRHVAVRGTAHPCKSLPRQRLLPDGSAAATGVYPRAHPRVGVWAR